jgi:hypothetical protein
MNRSKLVVAAALLLGATTAFAQQPPIPQYGPNITQEQARKAMAAAEAEARAKGWPMAIAIVDTAGQLVLFQRFDNTQSGSILVSQDKAVSAAMFRRPTKAFQDAVPAAGRGCASSGCATRRWWRAACRSTSRARSWAPSACPAWPPTRTA